jgi:organic radical activating enzyme
MNSELLEKLENLFKGYHFSIETNVNIEANVETIRTITIKGLTPFQKEHKLSWSVETQMDLTALMGKQVEDLLFNSIVHEVFKAIMKMKIE